MLGHEELNPNISLRQQYGDKTSSTTILPNVFSVDPKDREAFKEVWKEDAEFFFERRPGYISAQLHQGIGDSHMWFSCTVFENTATFEATNEQPEFKP
jgi:heme-degrading monooxygenase HmoA